MEWGGRDEKAGGEASVQGEASAIVGVTGEEEGGEGEDANGKANK